MKKGAPLHTIWRERARLGLRDEGRESRGAGGGYTPGGKGRQGLEVDCGAGGCEFFLATDEHRSTRIGKGALGKAEGRMKNAEGGLLTLIWLDWVRFTWTCLDLVIGIASHFEGRGVEQKETKDAEDGRVAGRE